MREENNRLFHWMGPKKVIWIPEKDIKYYSSPEEAGFLVGVPFLIQHATHGTWSKGVRRKNMTIEWTQVIIIKEK